MTTDGPRQMTPAREAAIKAAAKLFLEMYGPAMRELEKR